MQAASAGLSVIGGISSISSKNRQAREQREQIRQQQYQQGVATAAQEQQLASQQVLARQQYQMSVLSDLASYQQARVGLAAQRAQSYLQAQSERQAINTALMEQQLQASAQRGQLDRADTQVQLNADNAIGGALTAQLQGDEQLQGESRASTQRLTEAQRKLISEQSMGRMSSTSSELARDRSTMESLADAFSSALGVDRASALASLQSAGEESMALIAEQIGLNDIQQSREDLVRSLQLASLGGSANLANSDATLASTLSALDSGSQSLDYNQAIRSAGASDAYRATDYSLGLQRDTNAKAGASVQSSLSSAANSVRGAGLLDYLQAGYGTYQSVVPLLRGQKNTTPTPRGNYSGFPTAYSNIG
jgi:hypothetical protein